MAPRPFFFSHVMGIRAYMLGRSIVMKAVGMWHWEVQYPSAVPVACFSSRPVKHDDVLSL